MITGSMTYSSQVPDIHNVLKISIPGFLWSLKRLKKNIESSESLLFSWGNFVRAIVLNEYNQIALLKVIRNDDEFGPGNYYETPGGGKEENESFIEGVIREVEEEIGYTSSFIQEIGIVEDYYNAIYRKNINHYYLLKVKGKSQQHFESYGDLFIKDVIWVSIDEAISLYEKMNKDKIEKLVRNRELPILKIVKEILGGKENG